MKVEVIRSAKRRKTVQAREVDGVLRVSIPASMTRADEERWVAEMVKRIERQRRSDGVDLPARASRLAHRYGLRRPKSITWVDNQEWRWGSCTPSDGTIRISSRLAAEPGWVLDYVIVHELAHLAVPAHNADFWQLVDRYPKAERAKGFLIARGMQGADDEGDLDEELSRLRPAQPPAERPGAGGATRRRHSRHRPQADPGGRQPVGPTGARWDQGTLWPEPLS